MSRDEKMADLFAKLALVLISFEVSSVLSYTFHLGDWVDGIKFIPPLFLVAILLYWYFRGRVEKRGAAKSS